MAKQATAEATKPEKKTEEKMVTTRELADKHGVKPAMLRRFLRSLPQYQDKNYTRYKWSQGDKFLNTISESLTKFKEKEKARNKERLDKVKAKGKKGTDEAAEI